VPFITAAAIINILAFTQHNGVQYWQ